MPVLSGSWSKRSKSASVSCCATAWAHMLTASGLLFDIAGTMRLFLHDRITHEISQFTPNQYGNYPSVVTRELITPKGVSITEVNDRPMSFFYYKQRGIVFLFLGFVLQMLGDWA